MPIKLLVDEHPLLHPSQTGRIAATLAKATRAELLVPSDPAVPTFSVEGLSVTPVTRGELGAHLEGANVLAFTGLLARLTQALAKSPRVEHQLLTAPLGYHPWYFPVKPWARATYNAVHRRLARRSSYVVAASDWEAADIEELAPSARPVVLPPGVDVELVRRLAQAGAESVSKMLLPPEYAVCFGPNTPNRRTSFAEAACNALDIPLVLLGGQREAPNRSVVASPASASEEHYAILAGAKVVIHVPTWEPTSPHLIEALALGVPFVASHTGSALDLSARSKCPIFHVQDQRDASAVLRGIVRAWRRLKEAPPTQEAMRAAADAYSWKTLLPTWASLLEGHPPPNRREVPSPAPVVIVGDESPTERVSGLLIGERRVPGEGA